MSYSDHDITTLSDPGPRYLRVYEDGRDSVVVDSDGNVVDEKWHGFIVKGDEVHFMPDETTEGLSAKHFFKAAEFVYDVIGGRMPLLPKQPKEPAPTNDDWWKWGEYADG